MSAYNRKPLDRNTQDSLDNPMDESGYASFQVALSLHNSTVEAPFLINRDNETENCRNVGNTHTFHHEQKDLTSTQFQTPSSDDADTNSSLVWRQSLCLPAASSTKALVDTNSDSADEAQMSPLPNQNRCVTKRRKQHFQAAHTSPKKSKKKLFLQPATASTQSRTRFYNGVAKLDIIGMLSNTLPALECIFKHVNAPSLDAMTKVSKQWSQAVQISERAMERLHNHRFKMNLTKENLHAVKKSHKRSKLISNCTVPLQPANANPSLRECSPVLENSTVNSVQLQNASGVHRLVEQSQRIKCPRCGKGSKVYRREPTSTTTTTSTLSHTLPLLGSSCQKPKPLLTRFHSIDEMQSSRDENIRNAPGSPYKFAECTSVLCNFRFCVHCNSQPHPGQKCLVTELGTPSKLVMPCENVTPPKKTHKYNTKLSRKNSLKRLCF